MLNECFPRCIRNVHPQVTHALVLLFFAFAVPTLYAQSVSGSIYGTVADETGASIPGCKVEAKDVNTGVSQSTTTNESGDYTFPTVSPGEYQIAVTATGFKSQTQTGVILAANQNVHVTFKLALGSITEKVEVLADVTMVDTREAQVAETIPQQQLQELPDLNRSVYDLALTVPGVTNYSAGQGPLTGSRMGASFSVNGLPIAMVSFYLDGAYNNTYKQDGSNNVPNPDALQEFRLTTSNFDAEFGRSPGGVVSFITRSGTSTFHGEAYDYIRNDVFNAKNYFLNSVTPLKQNQLGGNFGGPLQRNRNTFFFVSDEGTISHTPANVAGTSIITATSLERSGDFRQSKIIPKVSCNGVAGVICPSAIDPVAAKLLAFVPVYDPVSKSTVQQTTNGNTTANQALGRVDYHGFQGHSIEAMFFNQRGTQNNPTAGNNQIVSYSGMVDFENQVNAVLADTWIPSPRIVNSSRIFYTQNRYIIGNTYKNHFFTDLGSQASEGGPSFAAPYFSIQGYWNMGTSGAGPSDINQLAYGLIDTVNLDLGHHSVKTGGSYVRDKYMEDGGSNAGGSFTFTGSTTGNALADFMEGKANNFSQNNSVVHRTHTYDPALYIQDDWQVTRRVNVNLGLRWEVFPPFLGDSTIGTFAANVQSTVIPSAPLGMLYPGDKGIPPGLFRTPWNKFAPRVGFAVDLFGNGKTSLRGGYGIFYYEQDEQNDSIQLQQPFALNISVNKTPNLVTPYAPNPDPFPFVYNPAKPGFVSGATVLAIPPNGGSIPYVEEYNLSVEQQLTPNFAIHVGYVGNATRKDYLVHDSNAPRYVPGASTTTAGINARRPYQPTPTTYTFAAINLNDNVNNGTYNSLQTTLRGRIGPNSSILASYVWGKSLNFNSPVVDGSDIGLDYGAADVDIRQRFVASYTYELSGAKHFGFVGRKVLSGWQISGITSLTSGNPFTVTSGVDTNLNGTNNDRVDVLKNPYLHGSRSRAQKIQEFIDATAFKVPSGPNGDEQRNQLYGPADINTNLSLVRDFRIRESLHLRFRADAFNAFGNVNLNNPRTTLNVLTTGASQITGAADGRIWQLAGKLIF